MITPVPPIFVVEWPDDVYVYDSVEAAALSLEPWWVEQNLGGAFDAEGRLLDLGIDQYNVVISLAEETQQHASEFRSILLSFLTAIGERLEDEPQVSLAALVARFGNRVRKH